MSSSSRASLLATYFATLFIFWAFIFFIGGAAAAEQLAPEQYESLRYRHIGPVGNRVSSVAGVPGDRMIYFVGAASGGIWKTTDGGINWEPVFDDQPVHSIGSLAVAPSDRTSFGRAPAKHSSVRTCPSETESGGPPTRAPIGSTWDSRVRGALGA